MTDIQLLNIKEVSKITGISRPSIYRLMNEGNFPKPLKLAPKTVRWSLATLIEWVNSHESK